MGKPQHYTYKQIVLVCAVAGPLASEPPTRRAPNTTMTTKTPLTPEDRQKSWSLPIARL